MTVFKDYNILTICFQGRHALVYDMNTASEAWEWVNLKEVILICLFLEIEEYYPRSFNWWVIFARAIYIYEYIRTINKKRI